MADPTSGGTVFDACERSYPTCRSTRPTSNHLRRPEGRRTPEKPDADCGNHKTSRTWATSRGRRGARDGGRLLLRLNGVQNRSPHLSPLRLRLDVAPSVSPLVW